MEEDHPEKRLDDLAESIMNAYVFMAALLGELPIPIGIPHADPEDWEPEKAIPAIQRARSELIHAEPIDEQTIRLLDRMMLSWLNAYELGGFMVLVGTAPWRLDGAEQQLADTLRLAAMIARNLSEE